MLSKRRIIYLAYLKALDDWYNWKVETERKPESEIAEYHERESWEVLKELENMLIMEERENG